VRNPATRIWCPRWKRSTGEEAHAPERRGAGYATAVSAPGGPAPVRPPDTHAVARPTEGLEFKDRVKEVVRNRAR